MKKIIFYFTFFPIFIFCYSNISTTCCKCERKITTYFDYLFWKTFENGLDYAYTDRRDVDSGLCGDIVRATYHWDSGFRVGVKYQFDYDDWIFDLQYGNFCPQDKQRIYKPEFTEMSSTFALPSAFDLTKASSKVRISMNNCNILLERYFPSCERIKFGFLSGLSGIWVKRNWEMKFSNGTNSRTIKPSWHFKGFGIKTGLDFDWVLKYGFNWTGRSAIALIFGNFDNWMIAYDNSIDNVVEFSHLDDFRIVPNLQFLLGPSWEKKFCRFYLKIIANYEINIWLNLAQVDRSSYQSPPSNPQSRFTNNVVQMHGLTLSAILNF